MQGGKGDAAKYAHKIIDQMIACDDYLTFKKMMFKRNKELEYEAISAMTTASLGSSVPKSKGEADKELKAALRASKKQAKAEEAYRKDLEHKEEERSREAKIAATEDEQLRLAMQMSELSESERAQQRIAQLEAEEAELAKAIAMSLAVEEERRKMLAKGAAETAASIGAENTARAEAEEKSRREAEDRLLQERHEARVAEEKRAAAAEEEAAARRAAAKATERDMSRRQEAKRAQPKSTSPMRERSPMKALPKLKESGMKFRQATALDPIQTGKRSFAEQRRAVEAFLNDRNAGLDSPGLPHVPAPRASASPGIDEDALEERKRHLRAQREKILMAKRASREQRLKEFNSNKVTMESKLPSIGSSSGSVAAPSASSSSSSQASSSAKSLSYALARRMKQELILEDEHSQNAYDRAGGFNQGFAVYTDLDSKLRAVQELRRERLALWKNKTVDEIAL